VGQPDPLDLSEDGLMDEKRQESDQTKPPEWVHAFSLVVASI
jgi:hypothetical protein